MAEEDPRVEEVREHFTLRKLQERVWRLESENKDLKVNNSILQTQYNSQTETQSDILKTLHQNLEEQFVTIEKGDKERQRLEQLLEDQKQEWQDKLETERAKWEGDVAKLQQENELLQNQLNEVREFQKNKETLEADLASLKRQLAEQAEAHARDIGAVNRKKAIDIDQLKKDMQKSIKETREMLKARTKDQLDSTTKRTIMENEQMATELHFQSKETERLLDRNQALLEENAQLRRNLLIHKDLENELARRTHVYQRLLKKMDQKQKADAASQEQSRDLAAGSSISDAGRVEEDTMRDASSRDLGASGLGTEEAARLQGQIEETTQMLQMVRHEFAQYKRDHATLTQLQDQSTRLIISALYDLKNQKEAQPFPPASYDPDADWQFANMTGKQKEYFFRVLLEKLNSSMCGSCFPSGPGPGGSATSLPAIGKQHDHTHGPGHFSQFLWSVASHGGAPQHTGPGRKETCSVAAQTETVTSDPCLQEGMWHPKSKSGYKDQNITPGMVIGGVRSWGPKVGRRTGRAV